MSGTKKQTWIKVALVRTRTKPPSLLQAKTLKHRRVVNPSKVMAPSVGSPKEKKVEVVELEEVDTPTVVAKVTAMEAPKMAKVTNPVEPLSTPLKVGKKPWSFSFDFLRVGDKVTLLALLTVTVAFLGGISFAGILQSTESIGTSGILVRMVDQRPPPTSPPTPLPPEPMIEIDVYSDENCASKLTEVHWGSIEVGDSIDRVIYVMNSGETDVILTLLTDDLSPTAALDYMTLSWDYDSSTLRSGEVLKVILTLDVEESIPLLGEFSFEIIIVGSTM